MKRTSFFVDPVVWAEFEKVASDLEMDRAQLLRLMMKRRVAEHRNVPATASIAA